VDDKMAFQPDQNIRGSAAYQEAERFLAEALAAGLGEIFDLTDLAVSPDGGRLVATGSSIEKLEGLPQQRICLVDLATGTLTSLTDGAHRDRLPRWSPNGTRIAFLSDAAKPYDFQLRIQTLADGSTIDVKVPDRWVEALQWSSDGNRILLLTAGLGADLAGAQGAISAPVADTETLAWVPRVDVGVAETQWRSLWIYDVTSGVCRQASPVGINIWEGCRYGPDHLACIASDGPSEDHWYEADVRLIEVVSATARTLYQPRDQVGMISASPTGGRIAFVEAICSDRMLVAGTMMAGSLDHIRPIDTAAVDVTYTGWQGDDALLYAGMRNFETVLGLVEMQQGVRQEIWASDERTFGNALFPDAAPGPKPGEAVVMAESYLTPPSLLMVSNSKPERTLAYGRPVASKDIASGAVCDRIRWRASDGFEIQGWLVSTQRATPAPLIVQIHGGPVWRARPRYVGRGLNGLLLRAGYALFQPNPRGSNGQGQDYARVVFGDAGGADARDILEGLDHLATIGAADPARIGVMGGSYGGFMTAWLVTQDPRFAAAVAIAPVSDWTSAKLTSHVGRSIEMMMGEGAPGPNTHYFNRSPALHARHAVTPTLTICGALDRSTPPVQAEEFHHALIGAGAKSVLLTYPQEGHGVRQFPALIDFTARVWGWFAQHMPAGEMSSRMPAA
jgi:dipeptidyl aminopeptidase/acylaminoacyl peptidase